MLVTRPFANLTRPLCVLVALLLVSIPSWSSDDPAERAEEILRESVRAMGGHVPDTAKLRGAVAITEGARRDSGSFEVWTRGVQDSRESIVTADPAMRFLSRVSLFTANLACGACGRINRALMGRSSSKSQKNAAKCRQYLLQSDSRHCSPQSGC